MIRLDVRRAPCPPADVPPALAALDGHEGVYFGVDTGIAGLHPLQATLATRPALRLALFADGAEVRALTPLGQALLAHQALAGWRSRVGRGRGEGALAIARALLACFEPSADVLLVGALPFEAWRLALSAAQDGASLRGNDPALGVLYLPEHLLRRNAEGHWTSVQLGLPGLPAEATPPASAAGSVPPVAAEPADDLPAGGYAAMVERALAVLRERPLVSLTLSASYRRRVELPPSQAFARLRAANPAPASFFLNDGSGLRLFGASPDLQLVVANGEVQALPVCGTVARRPGAQGEAESLRELFNEEVDAAALAVCSDALRNDLAPLCEPGSLRLLDRRRPMSLATVVHAVDRLAGRLREGCDAWDAIAATAAPVMLTGTPRPQALQAIAELEASPRGWYGGMVVQVASNGDALAGTILRAAAVRDGIAEVRTGGDLLADSAPPREEAESRLKTRSVWRAFGLETDAATNATAAAPGARRPLAVQLQAEGDPFAAALADCLAGLNLAIDPAADVVVVAGRLASPGDRPRVFVGDAAYEALAAAGAAVETCAPEQGRALEGSRCADGVRFSAGRYARHRLVAAPPGWTVHAVDAGGAPLALARGPLACLLYRPDSLLSDDTARGLLRSLVEEVGALA
ncbi:chorismate-binding protein [Ramlibacter sp.]|uniref:chorismate-binding protein n=1 Tax=Ramlibacter sp. TaxID=1917967 RepID=UPI002D37D403|nr:chorismate-binding protein [Ramlibacter sp.]HYD76108.1 chorismate-binding protein [Ramlibacter sp.]